MRHTRCTSCRKIEWGGDKLHFRAVSAQLCHGSTAKQSQIPIPSGLYGSASQLLRFAPRPGDARFHRGSLFVSLWKNEGLRCIRM